jgi:Heterokaryon incompatibility protein (HET)
VDWLNESALMDKVYSNSFCNISATGVADSSYGLFATRDPRMLGSVEVDLKLAGLQATETATAYTLVDFLFWQNELSRAHLNRRGWVVQERLLAPRVLHFGQKQLFWECCEMDAAESYPNGLPHALAMGVMTKFKSLDRGSTVQSYVSGDLVTTIRGFLPASCGRG